MVRHRLLSAALHFRPFPLLFSSESRIGQSAYAYHPQGYPTLYLLPTQNATTNRTVFEGSYVGASSFAAWEDSNGNNRRMQEVRNKSYEASLDNTVMVRVCDAGAWGNYRVFHAGMPSPVPIANGGTGAANATTARTLLGTHNAANITTGTLAMARLPFKVAYGSGQVNGNSALYINYSSAGFTSIPCVIMIKAYEINWSTNTVTMTKKFAAEANQYGTEAYNTLMEMRSKGFQIVVRENKPRKACSTRISFMQMETLLSCMEYADERLEQLHAVMGASRGQKNPYEYTCSLY